MKIIECPRDAMQGLESFIPTEDKINYINQLMKVGFDTLDAGSFVSAKAIPQMRDTAEVMNRIDRKASPTKILVIVANIRGAEEANRHEAVDYLGFPLSLSETFQQRNTHQSITTALNTLHEIQNLCVKNNKTLVTYLSMGFGNPYGDPYDVEVVARFVDILKTIDVGIISLADTIGVSTPEQISYLFTNLHKDFGMIELGAHLHSSPSRARERIAAAVNAGCQRFDGALRGFGGCPMAEDELVGNLATETIVNYLDEIQKPPGINREEFLKAMVMADEIFPPHS